MMQQEYEEPRDVDDAETRITKLQSDVQDIACQLADKNKHDESGNRLDSESYWSWRKRAIYAMEMLKKELRWLKLWRKKALRASWKEVYDEHDPGDLLYKLYKEIRGQLRDPDPGLYEVLELSQSWLRGAGYDA